MQFGEFSRGILIVASVCVLIFRYCTMNPSRDVLAFDGKSAVTTDDYVPAIQTAYPSLREAPNTSYPTLDCRKHKYIFVPGDDGGQLAHSMLLTFMLFVFHRELEEHKRTARPDGRARPPLVPHIPVVPTVKLEYLGRAFLPLDVDGTSWISADDETTAGCLGISVGWTTFGFNSWRTRTADALFDKQLMMDPWPARDVRLAGNLNLFRRMFRTKPELRAGARDVLRRAKRRAGLPPAARVVSVHVRRNEYVRYVEREFKWPLYTPRFLNDLIRNVSRSGDLVVVVSDDVGWCERHVARSPNLAFLGSGVGVGSASAESDFAVLAEADVAVVTFGGFGFFAAVLAGARVIRLVPDTKPEYMRYFVASSEKLPGVSYVSYLDGGK